MSFSHSTPPPSPEPKPRSGVYLPPAHTRPASPATRFELAPRKPRQRHGVPEWLAIIWTALCAIWFWGVMIGSNDPDPAIMIVMVSLVWGFGAFWLLIFYLVARAGRRRCPVCGNHVQPGLTRCGACAHDFAAAARQNG